jgi:uncharacterized protein (DUF433 family)
MAELKAQLPEFLANYHGEIRLTGHRIGLFSVIRLYREGHSAEGLALQFPTLSMAQIHKVLAFYWENQRAVDEYVNQFDSELAELERQNPTRITKQILRDRLAKMHAAATANTNAQ